MIEATNLHKNYGSLEVLKGVDIKVEKGEVISIVGASGAGKTTLLQILGTLDTVSNPQNASLFINGSNVLSLNRKGLAQFRNQHLGFVFQFHQLLPEFSALENVCIPGFIANKPKKEVENEAARLLDFLGLSDRIHHKPGQLSGGEQQRVAVARALVNKPEVIFADEPSGNLDSAAAQNLHQLFFDLRDQFGQTFVIVTHNDKLADMADRKLTMKDGKII
ncbi:MAG: lipoprotein-releasing system ATP-binding protein LolD [Bacteroidetes bacterium HGW-Bacteroidetes-13]|nr:MAG: lipoprotein-releasing system ATP-binding protein LolD [Bacteroidetes bacterium HGW-Bacteroidetes-13]